MNSETPSPIEVEVQDLQQLVELDRTVIEKLVEFVLIDQEHRGRIGLCFVDDEHIAALHKEFMDDPSPTDVITFPLEEGERGVIDGEIVVSTETAMRQAPEHHLGPCEEVYLYVIHGLLHLMGHDDLDPREAALMSRLQNALLERWRAAEEGIGD